MILFLCFFLVRLFVSFDFHVCISFRMQVLPLIFLAVQLSGFFNFVLCILSFIRGRLFHMKSKTSLIKSVQSIVLGYKAWTQQELPICRSDTAEYACMYTGMREHGGICMCHGWDTGWPKNSLGAKRNPIFFMRRTHLSTQKQGAPRSHLLMDRSWHLLDGRHRHLDSTSPPPATPGLNRRPLPQHQQATASPLDGRFLKDTQVDGGLEDLQVAGGLEDLQVVGVIIYM